jgi:all-trans-8'-apo-beta-carotenal 15,15'-oxygenase
MTAQITAPRSYDPLEWQQGYRSLKEEYDYWIDDIDGQIPPELSGTLFRNGPGMLDVNGVQIQHPFDGDGMICAIGFQDGRAHFRNRYVRTEGYVAEQAAGKILYRGVFGTQRPGGWLANAFDTKLKNIANTQVIYWGGKLLALWEAAQPHRLDPVTLDTLGLESFDGKLASGAPFAAHPWIDPASKFDNGEPCLVNFGIQAGLSFTLMIYELDLAGNIRRQHSHPLPGFAFIHDFAITPNYCIFFQNPVLFNPLPFVFGARGAGECIQFQPDRPTRILLVPRDGVSPVITLETKSGFVFHHSNAFEVDGPDQPNEIVIDSICYANLPAVEAGSDFRDTNFADLAPGQLWRFRMDLAQGTVTRELLNERCCEFPVVHPAKVGQAYRYSYMAAGHSPTGNAPLQGIQKVDVLSGTSEFWSAAPQGYVNEPVFVPRGQGPEAAEDEGWLLVMIYDGGRKTSAIVILDATTLTQVARLHLKHHVPYGLHGTFTPEYFAPISG